MFSFPKERILFKQYMYMYYIILSTYVCTSDIPNEILPGYGVFIYSTTKMEMLNG